MFHFVNSVSLELVICCMKLFVLCKFDCSFQQMGRSEIIKNSSNPDFLFSFSLDYSFGECQKLKFEV